MNTKLARAGVPSTIGLVPGSPERADIEDLRIQLEQANREKEQMRRKLQLERINHTQEQQKKDPFSHIKSTVSSGFSRTGQKTMVPLMGSRVKVIANVHDSTGRVNRKQALKPSTVTGHVELVTDQYLSLIHISQGIVR